MPSLFRITFHIRAASNVNRWLYFISRLPLVGRLLPDRAYAAGGLKDALTLVITILQGIGRIFTKALYLFGLVVLPAELLTTGDLFAGFSGLWPTFVHILFWLSCVIPFFTESNVLKATKDKFICIKYMRANPRAYMMATVPFQIAIFYLSYLPALILCALITGGGLVGALMIWLMLIAFRLAGEAFQLWWFGRFGFSLFRKTAPVWALMLLALAAAYLPVGLGWPLYPAALLLSVPGLIVMALLLAASAWYVFWGYKNWQRAISQNLKAEYVVAASSNSATAFKDVQIREADLDTSPKQSAAIQRKKGYAYFNALFFSRHRRLLFRPVLIRLIIVGAVFAAALVALAFVPREMLADVRNLPRFLPIFVFIMYFASMGAKACKAMFYNCDNSMLRYPFYRLPGVIVQNFNIRLRYVSGYNLLVGAAICAGVVLVTLVAGGQALTLSMLAFCLSVLLLSVFFSVHHLFLYYVFQPYTSDLNVKNPFYSILNTVVYIACFACLQINTAGVVFAFGVLAVTILYIIIALLLVYRLSPKRFRVK